MPPFVFINCNAVLSENSALNNASELLISRIIISSNFLVNSFSKFNIWVPYIINTFILGLTQLQTPYEMIKIPLGALSCTILTLRAKKHHAKPISVSATTLTIFPLMEPMTSNVYARQFIVLVRK